MNPKDLALIKEIKNQLEDIRSTLDEIAENLSSLNNAGMKVESASYYIGEATELLNKIEEEQ